MKRFGMFDPLEAQVVNAERERDEARAAGRELAEAVERFGPIRHEYGAFTDADRQGIRDALARFREATKE